MSRVDADFKHRVYDIVAKIPKGRVTSYGAVAAGAGAAWAAWEVGQIAHTGPSDLPWQRVVQKSGGLARGYPSVRLEASGGLRLDQARAVAETGVDFVAVGALTHSSPALDLGLDLL